MHSKALAHAIAALDPLTKAELEHLVDEIVERVPDLIDAEEAAAAKAA